MSAVALQINEESLLKQRFRGAVWDLEKFYPSQLDVSQAEDASPREEHPVWVSLRERLRAATPPRVRPLSASERCMVSLTDRLLEHKRLAQTIRARSQDAPLEKKPVEAPLKEEDRAFLRAAGVASYLGLKQTAVLRLSHKHLNNLPASVGMHLQNVEEIFLDDNHLTRMPPSVSSMRKLKKIHLGRNDLQDFPEVLGKVPSPQEVNLCSNRLKDLPQGAFAAASWQALTKLDVSFNFLARLPDSIVSLVGLVALHANNNRIAYLPRGWGRLTALQSLHLHCNLLPEIPSDLGGLRGLRDLSLQDNQLSSLPESMGALRALHQLSLQQNRLEELPQGFKNLSALVELDVSNNLLTSLPPGLGKLTELQRLRCSQVILKTPIVAVTRLTSLEELDLRHAGLEVVPEQLCLLTALIKLDLSENHLTSVTVSWGKMKALQSLNLAGNQLTALDLGEIPNLRSLYVQRNCISTLPKKVLEQFPRLQRIDISSNRLDFMLDVPVTNQILEIAISANCLYRLRDGIGRLTKVEYMAFAENSLKILPANLGKCVALRRLDLSRNPIAELPAEFADLKESLEELDLSSARLAYFPPVLCSFKKLRVLTLSRNRFDALPDGLVGCTALEELRVADNLLTVLPQSIGDVKSLKTLDISRNEIPLPSLPSSMARLKCLRRLQAKKIGEISPTLLKKLVHLELLLS